MKKVLIVKAKRNGYRRCGYGFSDTSPTEIPLDKLSAEEIETLTNDSGLIVVEAGEGEAAAAAIKSETRKEVAALQAKLKASEEALAAAEQRAADLQAQLENLKEVAAAVSKGKK